MRPENLTRQKFENAAHVAPRQIIVTYSPIAAQASLLAATEGETRFVTSVPIPHAGRPMATHEAVTSLAEHTGMSLADDRLDGVILGGPPLRVRVVGEIGDAEHTALAALRHAGALVMTAAPEPPRTRSSRIATWVDNLVRSLDDAWVDAALILTPSGALPAWAARLLTALDAMTLPCRIVIVASDPALMTAMPADARFVTRDDTLAASLTASLTTAHQERVLPGITLDAPAIYRNHALAAALDLARRPHETSTLYVDCTDGTTVIVINALGATIIHDAQIDAAAGAIALLERFGADAIARWLLFPIEPPTLRAWALRRAAWPTAILTDPTDQAICLAFTRAALRDVLARDPQSLAAVAHCILGPSFFRNAAPCEAFRLVADILPPVRALHISGDPDDLLPVAGFVARLHPGEADSLYAHDTLTSLGTLITHDGRATNRPDTGTLRSTRADQKVRAPADSLTLIHCPSDAILQYATSGAHGDHLAVTGGSCGLLIDTRNRPLRRATDYLVQRDSVSARLRTGPTPGGGGNV